MIARIGQGGMGDVWRADDLVLDTAVALKMIHRRRPRKARERILNEVRLARQITHPAVCRVFDVGEADGGVFYTMELVRRRGPRRAAAARRPAALGQGGRHRPAAVRRPGGRARAGRPASRPQAGQRADRRRRVVRITDFGIAITEAEYQRARADRHAGLHGAGAARAAGCRCRSAPTSTRWGWCCTSCWSATTAFDRSVDAGRAAAALGDRDPTSTPQLERVVMQALSREPRDRWASRRHSRWRRRCRGRSRRRSTIRPRPLGPSAFVRRPFWLAGLGLAALVAILVYASSFVRHARRAHVDRAGHDVLADFENTTGETGVRRRAEGRAGRGAGAVAVPEGVSGRSGARNAAADAATARRARSRASIAREIARREQLKALLAGSIASLGRNYVL